jgi:antitoxin component HigA of HigAB toxin-antitoxin module
LAKRKDRTLEEDSLFKLLVHLIEEYEEKEFQMADWCNTPPHEFLQFLLEARGWKQMDLVGLVSSSKGVVSAMVNGKRAISKAQAKKLARSSMCRSGRSSKTALTFGKCFQCFDSFYLSDRVGFFAFFDSNDFLNCFVSFLLGL